MISTDYSGSGDPNNATWVDLTDQATWSEGSFNWVGSGNISLNSFNQNGVYLAFKYIGTNSDGSTWEVDDIQIFNN